MKYSLLLIVLLLAGCGGGDSSGPAPTYSIGGSVSGLASGSTLGLTNGTDVLTVKANGSFTFAKEVAAGSQYSVTVTMQPGNPSQMCSVANGSGTAASAAVTNIVVTCVVNKFSVSVSVSGLTGAGLVLQDNAGDDLSVSANGTASFATLVASGGPYAVTIKTSPGNPPQNCAVTNATGTVASSAITNVMVACSTSITLTNAPQIAILGGRSAETVLQMSSFVAERLTFLSSHLAATAVENCVDPGSSETGTATYTFSDNDKSGTLSPGDTVTIVTTTCYSPSLSDYPTASLTVTVGAAPTGSYAFGFSATAQFTSLSLIDRSVKGIIELTYTDSDEQRALSASIQSPPLTIIGTSAGGFYQLDTISLQSATVSKTVNYVNPQYSATFASSFSSKVQQGTFQVSTPTALTGPLMNYFEIYPSAGVLEIAGGSTTLELTAVDTPTNDVPQGSLDDGSGTSADIGTLPWNAPFSGFPWWEPHSGAVAPTDQPGYEYGTLNMWGMGLIYAVPQQGDPVNGELGTNLPVTTAVKFFFSAPLDSTRTPFIYQPQYVSAPNIPATVTSNGAITTLTAPLQHGFTYELPPEQLYSTLNNLTGIFNQESLSTSNNLVADGAASPSVAAPGQTVNLVSARSMSTNSTIAGYRWVQTGGTAVQLQNATSATATYTVPSAAINGEALSFTLTITDANGETDSVPVTAFVLSNLSQPFLYFRQQQNSTNGLVPETATLESPLTGTVVTAQNTNTFDFGFSMTSSPFTSDELQLIGPYGTNLAVGTYQTTSTGNSVINETTIGYTCNTPNQTFTVLEIQTGTNGTVIQFAADFSEVCPDGTHAYTGSVRVNSTLPLP